MVFHSRLHVGPFGLALKVPPTPYVPPQTAAVNHVANVLVTLTQAGGDGSAAGKLVRLPSTETRWVARTCHHLPCVSWSRDMNRLHGGPVSERWGVISNLGAVDKEAAGQAGAPGGLGLASSSRDNVGAAAPSSLEERL